MKQFLRQPQASMQSRISGILDSPAGYTMGLPRAHRLTAYADLSHMTRAVRTGKAMVSSDVRSSVRDA